MSHIEALKEIECKLPEIICYSPEATKLLKEYRERVVEIIREVGDET